MSQPVSAASLDFRQEYKHESETYASRVKLGAGVGNMYFGVEAMQKGKPFSEWESKGNEFDFGYKYKIDDNQSLAKNLKGHLMLIHGDMDNNVNPAGTIRMANELIKANKRFEFMIMPGQRHGFGRMTEYSFWLRADHFSKYLLGVEATDVNFMYMNLDKPMIR